jgi:hypothetical protein
MRGIGIARRPAIGDELIEIERHLPLPSCDSRAASLLLATKPITKTFAAPYQHVGSAPAGLL